MIFFYVCFFRDITFDFFVSRAQYGFSSGHPHHAHPPTNYPYQRPQAHPVYPPVQQPPVTHPHVSTHYPSHMQSVQPQDSSYNVSILSTHILPYFPISNTPSSTLLLSFKLNIENYFPIHFSHFIDKDSKIHTHSRFLTIVSIHNESKKYQQLFRILITFQCLDFFYLQK